MRCPPGAAPTSTYRLQLSDRFTLFDAVDQVPYLARLGVGALYLSPLLTAVTGSQHGYDVVDHGMVDPARGGEAGLAALAGACREAGLGLVVDIVPNHMGVVEPAQNRAWWQLLEDGSEAVTGRWFDVDWSYGRGRVAVPTLGDDLAEEVLTLEDGQLGAGGHRYPVAPGSRRPGDLPGDVHARQHYRLVGPHQAATELNYRRFFAVSDLAGLRVEDPEVYRATHEQVLGWTRDHGVAGIRVDHPDGLADPGGYLDRLAADAPDAWITVEKITQPGERLPDAWPVAGTTGYDALAEVNGVLVDPGAEEGSDALYRRLTGDPRRWDAHVEAGKAMVVATLFRPEIARLVRVAGGEAGVAKAIGWLAVAFPVYRSYLPVGRHHLDRAVEVVRRTRPELAAAVDSLVPRLSDPTDELCVRFQQLTGAVMAKGVEDTAFFRYARQLSLNEVGGDPGIFGLSVPDFHAAQAARQEGSPYGMTTLSTHDTKWGEDVRARLATLAELPSEWGRTAELLSALVPLPDRPFAYLLWQTVVATGLVERQRLHDFATKAMREAATQTTWAYPDEEFEASVHRAVDAVFDLPEVRRTVEALFDLLVPYGWSNALSQKLLQLTMPGVPDVYQGSEAEAVSLVDPDNRRPVDRTRLAELADAMATRATGSPRLSGPAAKWWLTHRAVTARRDRPELFTGYTPLRLPGPHDRHLVAFDRGGAVTVATRLPVGLERAGGWGESRLELPPGQYRDTCTGQLWHGAVRVADLLAEYPAALLLHEERR
jgi:(1->4)-alpha-D-glucan 1-alpha-D-glucosylmutase